MKAGVALFRVCDTMTKRPSGLTPSAEFRTSHGPFPCALHRLSLSYLGRCVHLNAVLKLTGNHWLMDTPPYTPPIEHHEYFVDSLHIRYCDFAYADRGPFRMAVIDIGDTTAKTFAE